VSLLQSKNLLEELRLFHEDLKLYQAYRLEYFNKRLSESQEVSMHHLRDELVRRSGKFKSIIIELSARQYLTEVQGGQERNFDMWFLGLDPFFDSVIHLKALNSCIDATNQGIGKLELEIEMGIRDEQGNLLVKASGVEQVSPAKAFIAHEGETEALTKLKDFLDALGIEYLIAEAEPSNGRSVEQQVNWTYEPADFAIILATKGKAIDKTTGEAYMGMNVADELGRARVVFKNRIILLLEKGVEPHTNISEIVHERFTPGSMDKALIKIAKELTGWGLLRASKAQAEIECLKYPKS